MFCNCDICKTLWPSLMAALRRSFYPHAHLLPHCLFHLAFNIWRNCFQHFPEMEAHQSPPLSNKNVAGWREGWDRSQNISSPGPLWSPSNTSNYRTEEQAARWQSAPPLTFHLATNRSDLRLCFWQARHICPDSDPDDDALQRAIMVPQPLTSLMLKNHICRGALVVAKRTKHGN